MAPSTILVVTETMASGPTPVEWKTTQKIKRKEAAKKKTVASKRYALADQRYTKGNSRRGAGPVVLPENHSPEMKILMPKLGTECRGNAEEVYRK